MDWKSSLEALKDTLPQWEEQPNQLQEEENSRSKQSRLDIILDKKGRKGKEATIVAGFTCPDEDVAEIASMLKQRLGCGGSSRGGEILIQGDKRSQVLELLKAQGFKARII